MEPSLSARRAWIENSSCQCSVGLIHVALRKESVDRKSPGPKAGNSGAVVALRKESVDRKGEVVEDARLNVRRSPQGERG